MIPTYPEEENLLYWAQRHPVVQSSWPIKLAIILKILYKQNYTEEIKKKKDITLEKKGPYSQSYGFSSSHIWMQELNHKEDWAPKSWCSWTVVLKKTLESPSNCKEIKSVSPKGNQP